VDNIIKILELYWFAGQQLHPVGAIFSEYCKVMQPPCDVIPIARYR